jgi:radical SAM superfamily enzyme
VNSYADFSHLQQQQQQQQDLDTSQQQHHNNPQQQHDQQQQQQQSAVLSYYAPGFASVYKPKRDGAIGFGQLLEKVARVDPEMRIRFTSPHPKDFTEDVLGVISELPNVCKQLHMPAQSGSSSVLERMKRGYSREAYDALVAQAREVVPNVALSTDIITGAGASVMQSSVAVPLATIPAVNLGLIS